MNQKSKKIISREFLMLSLVIVIGIVTFIFIHFYSLSKQNEATRITKKIEAKTHYLDSLKLADNKFENNISLDENEIKILFDFDSKDGRHLSLNELKELISNPKERKLYFNEFNFKMKFKDYEEFEDLIQTDKSLKETKTKRNREDSIKNNQVNVIKQEINELNIKNDAVSEGVFILRDQLTVCFWSVIISLSLLFVLRYFYYAILWSISNIRKKDEHN